MKVSNSTEKKRYVNKILIWCFFVALLFLIAQTVASNKDVNDTWILEGVVPSFILFTVIYAISVILSSNLKIITILTSVYLGTLNLIPQLKYSFIYGYFDPLPHYGFIQDLITTGHVPTSGSYAIQYGPTPGSHLIISQLSILAGFGPLVAMKAFLLVSPFLIPLGLYFALRRLEIPNDLSKIIIIVSIITMPVLYRFVGTIGAYALYSLFTYSYVLFVCRGIGSRAGFILTLLLGTAVVVSHDVTAFFIITFLVGVSVLLWIWKHLKFKSFPLDNC